jgi:hypothetical protein
MESQISILPEPSEIPYTTTYRALENQAQFFSIRRHNKNGKIIPNTFFQYIACFIGRLPLWQNPETLSKKK